MGCGGVAESTLSTPLKVDAARAASHLAEFAMNPSQQHQDAADQAMIDVLGLTSPDLCSRLLGAVCVLRRHQLRALTESVDQLVERFILRFCLARLMTGA